MSWFKLNDSLNTLKGQLSNVTSVVQEAFQEGIVNNRDDDDDDDRGAGSVGFGDDENVDTYEQKLVEAVSRIDDLTQLCNSQDTEIETLRKHILELQAKSTNESISSGSAKTVVDNKNATTSSVATLEDSWFWDAEQTTTGSSASSSTTHKDNEAISSSKSDSGGDLTLIPLDTVGIGLDHCTTTTTTTSDKSRRNVDDKDQHVRRLKLENAILTQKVTELTAEHADCSANIDALDKEHGCTIDELMQLQRSVKQRCAQAELDVGRITEENQLLQKRMGELQSSFEKMQQSHSQAIHDNQVLQTKVDDATAAAQRHSEEYDLEVKRCLGENDILRTEIEQLNEQLKKKCDENIELLAAHDEKEKELLEKFEYVEVNRERSNVSDVNAEVADLQKQLDEQLLISTSETQLRQSIEDRCAELESSLKALNENYAQLLEAEPRTHEEFEAFKAEVADSESKLMQENLILKKQLIDLHADLNGKSIDAEAKPTAVPEAFAALLMQHVRIDASKSSVEEILQCVGDTLSRIDRNRDDLDELMEKFQTLSAEKKRIEHERDTIKADLHHYEIEVGELMKNNDLLLAEIDQLKTSKLETISEQNEDNIIILEKQLEDCSNLNQSLEDEYQEMRDQLDGAEMSRAAAVVSVERLEDELRRHEIKMKEALAQIENLEADKSNLLFELNELQAADKIEQNEANSMLETQAALAVAQLEQTALTDQLSEVRAACIVAQNERSEMATKLTELQNLLTERTLEFDETNGVQQMRLDDQEQLLSKKNADIEELLAEMRVLKADVEANKQFAETLLAAEREQLQTELDRVRQELTLSRQSYDSLAQINGDNERLLVERDDRIADMDVSLKSMAEQVSATSHTADVFVDVQHLESQLEQSIKEKNDLIAMIQAKHQENVQYHTEIQRLGQMLSAEMAKDCVRCTELQSAAAVQGEKISDQLQCMRENADILQKSLLAEQQSQKQLLQRQSELLAENQSLSRDAERLREHLMEIEEAHTQETVELQKTIDATKLKMNSMLEDAKKSSTAYTSASIRANQHTETLQTQYQLLTQQRDEYSAKLSAAEDKESRSQAALINLQCALEQFQKNKDHDIESVTHKLRRDLATEVDKQSQLLNEIQSLQVQLQESKNGLLAAARISDQLENYQMINANLKDELRLCQERCALVERNLQDTVAAHADKVEKGLLKNLFIGYVVAPNNNDKLQILKLITAVLEFNQSEVDRVGLNRTNVGWLNSIRNAAVAVGTNPALRDQDDYHKEGLAQAFVKFLEQESQPRTQGASSSSSSSSSLLNIVPQQHPSNRSSPAGEPIAVVDSELVPGGSDVSSSLPSSSMPFPAYNVPVAVQPILLSDGIMQSFAPARNSSSILKDILNDS